MTKKIYIIIAISAFMALLVVVGKEIINVLNEERQVACIMEARLCPDGSAVGRIPPKCEFAPCPDDSSPGKQTSGIRGTVLLGPTCPVMKDPPEEQCVDKPFQTTLALTTVDGSRIIEEFSSDVNGKFSVSVSPGKYAIRSAAAANVFPHCSNNETIIVNSGSFTETTIYCDTGIR